MAKNGSGKLAAAFEDLFYIMGVENEEKLAKIMPTTVEEAVELANNIQRSGWFKPQDIGFGGVFTITSALIDLRENDKHHWEMACAIINNLPRTFKEEHTPEDGCESAAEIYKNILLNMEAVRDRREVKLPKGLEIGHRVFERC